MPHHPTSSSPHHSTLVILTGAGISAESGLATFRASDGLWCNHRIDDVATPEAFARNSRLVHDFYNMRRAQLKEVEPNAAHLALAELAAKWQGPFLLVTQNVDDLHERAHLLLPPLQGGGPRWGCLRRTSRKHTPTLTLPPAGGGNYRITSSTCTAS